MPGDDDPLATRSLDFREPSAEPSPLDDDAALAVTLASGDPPPADEPSVGLRIDRYRIERRLGAGGMGVVYLAHDPDLDRRIAIKVLRPELRAGQVRLLREGQAIARLNHRNVVTVHDVGTHGDDLFIAMEYVDGVTLGRWLKQERRPWPQVLARFVAAGRGLAAAHAAGLVHRDFKPDNVLLGDDGRVVVSDFGLARVDERAAAAAASGGIDVSTTQTGTVLGTPAYMSPEQFRSEALDARSDQFSFCVALWLGLYGRRPFDPPDGPSLPFEALSQAVLSHAVVAPPTDRGVPAHLERVLRRGLAVDPAARFGSVDELLAALQPRDRRPLWIAAAAAGLLVAVTTAALITRDRSTTASSGAAACDADVATIDAVWNPTVRDRYLAAAAPDHRDNASEDARWFDEIAARWKITTGAVCRDELLAARSDPRRRACLAQALDALDRAIARPEPAYWAALRDPLACDGTGSLEPPQLRDVRSQIDDRTSAVLSDDGSQVAFASPGGERMSLGVDDLTIPTRALPVTQLLSWRDHRIVGLDEQGQVMQIADGASEATPLPITGRVVAVSPDLATVARRQLGSVVFAETAGQVVGQVPAQFSSSVAWEPGRRRVALGTFSDSWEITVLDLDTGALHVLPLRLQSRTTGIQSMVWRAPGRLLVTGAASADFSEGIWELTLDDDAALAGPPINVLPPHHNTAFLLHDLRAGRGLATVTSLSLRSFVLRDGVSTASHGGREGWVTAADAVAGRVLVETIQGVVLLDRAGAVVAETTERLACLYRGALAWMRVRGGTLEVITANDEVLASTPALTWKRGVVGCNTWRPDACVAVARDDAGTTTLLPLSPTGFGAPVPAPSPTAFDIAEDGRRVLLTRNDATVLVADLATGTTTELHRDDRCIIQLAKWLPGGRDLLFSGLCPEGYVIRRRLASGAVEPVLVSEGWISGIAPLDEHELRYSTRAYAMRLSVIDDLR